MAVKKTKTNKTPATPEGQQTGTGEEADCSCSCSSSDSESSDSSDSSDSPVDQKSRISIELHSRTPSGTVTQQSRTSSGTINSKRSTHELFIKRITECNGSHTFDLEFDGHRIPPLTIPASPATRRASRAEPKRRSTMPAQSSNPEFSDMLGTLFGLPSPHEILHGPRDDQPAFPREPRPTGRSSARRRRDAPTRYWGEPWPPVKRHDTSYLQENTHPDRTPPPNPNDNRRPNLGQPSGNPQPVVPGPVNIPSHTTSRPSATARSNMRTPARSPRARRTFSGLFSRRRNRSRTRARSRSRSPEARGRDVDDLANAMGDLNVDDEENKRRTQRAVFGHSPVRRAKKESGVKKQPSSVKKEPLSGDHEKLAAQRANRRAFGEATGSPTPAPREPAPRPQPQPGYYPYIPPGMGVSEHGAVLYSNIPESHVLVMQPGYTWVPRGPDGQPLQPMATAPDGTTYQFSAPPPQAPVPPGAPTIPYAQYAQAPPQPMQVPPQHVPAGVQPLPYAAPFTPAAPQPAAAANTGAAANPITPDNNAPRGAEARGRSRNRSSNHRGGMYSPLTRKASTRKASTRKASALTKEKKRHTFTGDRHRETRDRELRHELSEQQLRRPSSTIVSRHSPSPIKDYHICTGCGQVRSKWYHDLHPVREGRKMGANFCRRCIHKAKKDDIAAGYRDFTPRVPETKRKAKPYNLTKDDLIESTTIVSSDGGGNTSTEATVTNKKYTPTPRKPKLESPIHDRVRHGSRRQYDDHDVKVKKEEEDEDKKQKYSPEMMDVIAQAIDKRLREMSFEKAPSPKIKEEPGLSRNTSRSYVAPTVETASDSYGCGSRYGNVTHVHGDPPPTINGSPMAHKDVAASPLVDHLKATPALSTSTLRSTPPEVRQELEERLRQASTGTVKRTAHRGGSKTNANANPTPGHHRSAENLVCRNCSHPVERPKSSPATLHSDLRKQVRFEELKKLSELSEISQRDGAGNAEANWNDFVPSPPSECIDPGAILASETGYSPQTFGVEKVEPAIKVEQERSPLMPRAESNKFGPYKPSVPAAGSSTDNLKPPPTPHPAKTRLFREESPQIPIPPMDEYQPSETKENTPVASSVGLSDHPSLEDINRAACEDAERGGNNSFDFGDMFAGTGTASYHSDGFGDDARSGSHHSQNHASPSRGNGGGPPPSDVPPAWGGASSNGAPDNAPNDAPGWSGASYDGPPPGWGSDREGSWANGSSGHSSGFANGSSGQSRYNADDQREKAERHFRRNQHSHHHFPHGYPPYPFPPHMYPPYPFPPHAHPRFPYQNPHDMPMPSPWDGPEDFHQGKFGHGPFYPHPPHHSRPAKAKSFAAYMSEVIDKTASELWREARSGRLTIFEVEECGETSDSVVGVPVVVPSSILSPPATPAAHIGVSSCDSPAARAIKC